MNWRVVSELEASTHWDQWQETLGGCSFHQFYRWGQVKEKLGWKVLRLAAGETPTATAQVLLRPYPLRTVLAWIPGGPAGDLSNCGPALQHALRIASGARLLYCRANALRPVSPQMLEQLRASHWRKPSTPLNTGLSMLYDPSLIEAERTSLATGNWRHNLKRSGKYGLQLSHWECRDAAEIMALYQSMEQHKGLAQQVSIEEVQAMLDLMGDQLLLWRCDDAEGNPVAMRGCAIQGERAWDLFAAATPAARKTYASYACFWALMQGCSLRGVHQYDMGGIDPVNNRGVYDFKKGSGAQAVEYLGEWEWSTSRLLATGVNWMIKRRAGRI